MKYPILTGSITLLLASAFVNTAAAATISETHSLMTTAIIPDNDASGVVQIILPSTNIAILSHISLSLQTTGGWNGDLYAYLWHNGTLSVVVNRIGMTTTDAAGSATSGMNITLDDTATVDVHAPAMISGLLTGTYQPDGRAVDPAMAYLTAPRTQNLATFAGMPASGEWRLFVADTAAGDTATITSWSITLTGEAVPEPSAAVLLAISGLAALRRRNKRRV